MSNTCKCKRQCHKDSLYPPHDRMNSDYITCDGCKCTKCLDKNDKIYPGYKKQHEWDGKTPINSGTNVESSIIIISE